MNNNNLQSIKNAMKKMSSHIKDEIEQLEDKAVELANTTKVNADLINASIQDKINIGSMDENRAKKEAFERMKDYLSKEEIDFLKNLTDKLINNE